MENQMEKQAANHSVDVEKIRKYLQTMNLASNLSNSEVEQFIEIAKSFELNPFKREIYANKYGDKFSVIVGYETYIKRAERSGLLSGWNVRTEGRIDFQNLMNSDLRAIITIYRKDFEYPFVHDVFYTEYVGRRRDGSVTDFWKNKPITMIKKVATAQGFRLCFSDELGGMPYTSEELSTIEAESVVIESKPERKKKSNPEKEIKIESGVDQTNRIRILLDSIQKATNLDELVQIWTSNSDLHAEPVFKNSMTSRKNILKEKKDPIPLIEEIISNKEDIIKIEEKPSDLNSELFPKIEINEEAISEDIVDLIRKANSVDEILDLTFEVGDREVLRIAEERIKEIESK